MGPLYGTVYGTAKDWVAGLKGLYGFPCQKLDFVNGNVASITLNGSRHTHFVGAGAADIKYVIDWQTILLGMLGETLANYKMSDALFALDVYAFLHFLGKSPTGAVDFIIGPKVTETYFGPKLDVTRGPSHTYKQNSFLYAGLGKWQDKLAKGLTLLICATSLAGDMIAYDQGVITVDKDNKKSVKPEEWSFGIANGGIPQKIHGILLWLEGKCAELQKTEDAAREVAKHANDVKRAFKDGNMKAVADDMKTAEQRAADAA